jgi:hypothetical protein
MRHPAAQTLLSYAATGCPAQTCQPWTWTELEAVVARGAHPSAMPPEAIKQLCTETMKTVGKRHARLVNWNDIKGNPPTELKIFPIAMIPHKSRGFRAILGLSYRIRIKGLPTESVNDSTTKTAPCSAIDQLGRTLSHIVHAFEKVDEDCKIFMAKWDIKDGFWRLVCKEGHEWNFCYVLPSREPTDPVQLVVPSSLQMG